MHLITDQKINTLLLRGERHQKNLIKIADTVSEVKDIKHAFRANIKAQNGIDL
jgi:cob(I)alamin adenosyltransferase